MMDKMWTVVRREYLSRVKTKGFIIGTILTPLLLIAMMVLPVLFMFLKSDESKTIAVVDQTGEILDSLQVNLDDKNEAGQQLYNFIQYEAMPAELDSVKKILETSGELGELDGYIIIPASIYEDGQAEYYSKSVTNFLENGRLRSVISRAVTEKRIQRSGLDSEQIHQLVRRGELRTIRYEDGKEKVDEGRTEMLVWVLVAFIYMAMLIYGQIVMRSVIEEKTSRVVESVISSIKPFHLMAGKILGVGALGLTQYALWALAMGLLSLYGVKVMNVFSARFSSGSDFTLPVVPLEILVFFIVFFVLGYFLFATIYAAVGAMVNSDQEAQQFVFPVVTLVIVPFLFTSYIIGNPNSQLAIILSLVPFFAPIIMFGRMIVQMPPIWQVVLCLALMVTTILGMIWVAGRIYRVGVLMYGKRPTLPEIIKWIKYA